MGKSDLKKLKNLINRTRSSLKWKITDHEISDCYTFTILSNFQLKTHDIYYPDKLYHVELTDLLDYLHELCHATLAEQVHHQFGTSAFIPGTPDDVIHKIANQCKSAQDWFADALLYKIVPDLFIKQLELDLSIISEGVDVYKNKKDNWINKYSLSLLHALAIKFIGSPITNVGTYKFITELFLFVNPTNPSKASLMQLINTLLSLETDYKLNLVYYNECKTELYEVQIQASDTSTIKYKE